LIGFEGNSIFSYCLETKQKFRIAGRVYQPGYQDGTRDESRFHWPTSLTLSKDGETLFISDHWNRVIRAICVQTGITTTFAGQVDIYDIVDGPKEKACFKSTSVLKFSPDGNTLYVVDFKCLRTICIETGQVDTIHTFENSVWDFSLSPDGKHIYILNWTQVLKYNFESRKSVIVLKDKADFVGCELSKDGQLLFILNRKSKVIKVCNLATDEVINTITTTFKPQKMSNSINGKQLYINEGNHKNQVHDISNYCTNFKTFLQSQLFKQSFLYHLLKDVIKMSTFLKHFQHI
jgi:DNA-binding beta-propeller fold protein YncE